MAVYKPDIDLGDPNVKDAIRELADQYMKEKTRKAKTSKRTAVLYDHKMFPMFENRMREYECTGMRLCVTDRDIHMIKHGIPAHRM